MPARGDVGQVPSTSSSVACPPATSPRVLCAMVAVSSSVARGGGHREERVGLHVGQARRAQQRGERRPYVRSAPRSASSARNPCEPVGQPLLAGRARPGRAAAAAPGRRPRQEHAAGPQRPAIDRSARLPVGEVHQHQPRVHEVEVSAGGASARDVVAAHLDDRRSPPAGPRNVDVGRQDAARRAPPARPASGRRTARRRRPPSSATRPRSQSSIRRKSSDRRVDMRRSGSAAAAGCPAGTAFIACMRQILQRVSGVGVDAVRGEQHGGAALLGHDAVVVVPVVVLPPAAVKTSAKQPRQGAGVETGKRVVGPGELDRSLGGGPLPADPDDDRGVRANAEVASLRVPPRATNPTTGRPVTGWSSTPALTTEDWMVPSARTVETTQSPWSPATRPGEVREVGIVGA